MTACHDRPDRRSSTPRLCPWSRQRARKARSGNPNLIEELERRSCPSSTAGLAAAAIDLPIDPNVSRTSQLQGIGAIDLYQVNIDADGLFAAQVHPEGFDTRLSLLDGQGNLLIESEASSPQNPDDRVAQHVAAGDYFLLVEELTGGGGSYTLGTSFVSSTAPSQPLSGGQGSYSIAVADLNSDKIPDIITADYYLNQVLINIGNGDGTFQPPVAIPVDVGPVFVTTADLTGNGIQDIITANQSSNDVSILLGNGDGTFRPAIEVPAGESPSSVAVGDFTGNGHLDLAVTDLNGNDVQILLGNGDGTFIQGATIPTSAQPSSVTAADLDGNGIIDLAVATIRGSDLTIYQGRGDGTFTAVQEFPLASQCLSVVAGDFEGDGRPDLAVACASDNAVQILQNQGGRFVPAVRLQTGWFPYALTVANFNGDGHVDLAVANYGSDDISIFLGQGDGTFLVQAPVPAGAGTADVAAADLTGDGRADLVTADFVGLTVSVLMGNGDGTFRAPNRPALPTSPAAIVAADLTGNGIEDLIVADQNANDVEILLGRGDGSFRAPIRFPAGLGPWSMAVGDFTGDGTPDIVVANGVADTLTILLGNGDGTFRQGETLVTGLLPINIATGDLDGDGHLDLVVANYDSNTISIFYGRGDGTFENQVVYPVGAEPDDPCIAAFNGDGRPDIAVADEGSNDVSILMATGPRTYAPAATVPAGPGPAWLAAGDLNGDGKQDLVASDFNSLDPSYVTVLLGNGDGTFQSGQTYPVGETPFPVTLADLTGNGTLDIITGNDGTNDISVLMGRGDGTFLPEIRIPTGLVPYQLAVADFNGDGRPDIAVADFQSNDVTVLLNQSDGVFGPPEQISTGASQIATVTADFSGDGRLDLAIADPIKDTVTIMVGNGDGTFTTGQVLSVGIEPSGLAVGDFNGDGCPDLAVADASSDDVMVFLGLGDGTFSNPLALSVGEQPQAIVTGDFLHNGITDIAVADELSNDVSVLFGRGDGTFLPAVQFKVGAEPVALVAADLNGNGYTDLVTANRTSGDLTILWNLGTGNFQAQTVQYGGHAPIALAAGDLSGDGRIDLAVADGQDDQVSVLLSKGGRAFASPLSCNVGEAANFLQAVTFPGAGAGLALAAASVESEDAVVLFLAYGSLINVDTIPLGIRPAGYALGDFNGDGLPDVAFTTFSSDQVTVLLGTNDGRYVAPADTAPLPRSAPIVVDWNHDGTPDVFDLDQQGQLLLRQGQPGSPGEYQAPQIIGQNLGVAFSDIALVNSRTGPVLAALEENQPVVWLFSPAHGKGSLIGSRPITVPGAGFLVSMTAGDLDDNGLDDLVLVDRGNDQLILLYQAPDGSFSEDGLPLNVGYAPSEVAIADLNNDGWPDLVVSNTFSGDLSVFYGGPGQQFGPEIRLAAGLGAAVVVPQDGGLVRHTTDDPIGVTAGIFDASGLTDVVSVQSGADRISLLDGAPDGGLADPSLATSYSTGSDPTQVVAAPLTRDGLTDLVVLNQGSQDISIFLNNGKGGFITMPRVDAGNDPTGLAVSDINGDGIADLLVSNNQGDLLIILGNGNGTFKPYQRADQTVSLAVGDFNSTGQPEFVLSNTSLDQLSIEYGATRSFVQGRSQGLQAPGAVAVADLNGDGNSDIIVVNTGENDILVYLGLGGNRFEAPLRYFTGTDPVGLTVADLTGTGVPDLIVANAGSNDLSIFIGVGQGANWDLERGPRLRVGDEPVSTAVADDDGIPDIICVDQGSDNVVVLRGVGGGFFDDNDPLTLATGQSPIQAFAGKFDPGPGLGLAVIDSGSNDLTYYSNFLGGKSTPKFIPTGGLDPIAGVMGDYNNDGYNDLVIANNGDNLITVLEGGPDGLVLTDSDVLGQSVHPTDLVFTGADSGQLHLDVSAEGQNQVIAVTLMVGAVNSGSVAGGGNPATTSSPAAAPRGSLFSADGPFSVELIEAEPGTQEEASVQPGAPTSGPTGAMGQATLAMATVLTTLDQMINLSSGSVPGVINNLAQVGQVQISDIMSLENSAMETVAVLLVPRASLEHSNSHDITSAAQSEAGPSIADELALPRKPDFAHGGSSLESFLADLDGALAGVARDVLGAAEEQSGAWPPWVLHPSDSATAVVTVAGCKGLDDPISTLDAGQALRGTPERDIGANVALWHLPARDGENDQPSPSTEPASGRLGWMKPLGGILVISSVLLSWKAARNRLRAGRIQPAVGPMPTFRGTHATHRSRASKSLGSRDARARDLPPWLSGPMEGWSPSRGR